MPTTQPEPTIRSAGDVHRTEERPLGSILGVRHRVLWRDGGSMAGVMTVEEGHRLGAHTHRSNHHHMWVIDGHATILNRRLGPGSYVHIPGGVEHDIDATDTEGCTVYYLYLVPSPNGA